MHHLLRPTISVLLAALLWSTLARSTHLNAAAVRSVNVADSLYEPETITVQLGDTVAWNNTGAIPHTVSANDGSVESGNMNSGDGFAHTFNQPGTFEYYCKYHAVKGSGIGMIGHVVVEGAPAPPPEPSPAPPPPSPEPPPPEPSPAPPLPAPPVPSPEPKPAAPTPQATVAPVAAAATATATAEPSATPEPSATAQPTAKATATATRTAPPTAIATATVPPTTTATEAPTITAVPTTVASPAVQTRTEPIASNSASGSMLPIVGVVVLVLAAVGLWRWRSRR
jgi:plastocyanin